MTTTLPDKLAECCDSVTWRSALSHRRSYRFCLGMEIPGGPLAHRSEWAPQALTEEEEAALVYAAAGFTGPATGDLCYGGQGGGEIMVALRGRTTPSGDGIQNVGLLVANDRATYWIRRPQDFALAEFAELSALCRQGRWTEFYRRVRVPILDRRAAPAKDPLFNLSINRWCAHAPGTTSFVPVNDVTLMYLNGLLEVLSERTCAFILDERRGYFPAGLGAFAASKGGHLRDAAGDGRLATVRHVEQLVTEFVTVEQGMMIQNLALMAEAIGLGGYPSFANHEFGWFEAAGFTMRRMPVSRYLGVPSWVRWGMKLLGQDVEVPLPTGLERDGRVLLKPLCPPHYPDMAKAVAAVVEIKQGRGGLFGQEGGNPGLNSPAQLEKGAEKISPAAIAAVTAYTEYLWRRYGRFPVYLAPYRTTLCFQAGHVDADFYRKHYRDGMLGNRQIEDFERLAKQAR